MILCLLIPSSSSSRILTFFGQERHVVKSIALDYAYTITNTRPDAGFGSWGIQVVE